MFDLVIRNGKIVDGTGAPGFYGDLAIIGDRIAAIGKVDGRGVTEIDASGLVVAPGFIDVHTHYDAQVFWDPSLTPSCFHGVTTVVAGNCGFSIAPLSADAVPYLLTMLARVEGMPVSALEKGVPWNWESFAEYTSKLEGKVGLNIGFLAGHSAIRRVVMGERAVGNAADADELRAMCELLRQCLTEGALGFSSTLAPVHNDPQGNPVPSRAASREEMIELSSVCREFSGTSLEIVPAIGRFSDADIELMIDMALAADKPLNWNVLNAGGDNALIDNQLSASDRAAARGARVVALTTAQPMTMRLNLLSGTLLDSLDGWQDIFKLSLDERRKVLSDPDRRTELDRRGNSEASGIMRRLAEWERYIVTSSKDVSVVDRSIEELAARSGKRPIDVMLDIAIADDFETTFLVPPDGARDEDWIKRGELWRDHRTVIGASDAGAHLDMIDQFALATVVLGEGVRRRGLLNLEEGVQQLTQVPAQLVGLVDRGVLRKGFRADITVFDADMVDSGPVHLRADLPGGDVRLFAEAIGISHVIVNGTPVVRDGDLLGAFPGSILRSGSDTQTMNSPVEAALADS